VLIPNSKHLSILIMKTLNDALLKIYQLPKFARTTLDPVFKLAEDLNNPHLSFKSVHITGTNGKGTVATKISKGLIAEGYRTGLFVSPHIERFTERITVNGEEINEDTFIRLTDTVLSKVGDGINQFDAITMIAFKYFEEQKIDWGSIEVGIGGEIDSTNIL